MKVGVIFEGGKLKPVWFIHENRKYLIKTINFFWYKKNGISTIYYFSVSDGINNFELSFDDKKLLWQIEQFYT